MTTVTSDEEQDVEHPSSDQALSPTSSAVTAANSLGMVPNGQTKTVQGWRSKSMLGSALMNMASYSVYHVDSLAAAKRFMEEAATTDEVDPVIKTGQFMLAHNKNYDWTNNRIVGDFEVSADPANCPQKGNTPFKRR